MTNQIRKYEWHSIGIGVAAHQKKRSYIRKRS